MSRFPCLVLVATLASHLPLQAQEKKDPPKNFTNNIGMKFVWIPPGTFMMGSPKEEKERGDDETQHKVTLTKGYYMGIHLVTQEQWKEIMGNNPSHSRAKRTAIPL
jgi:formylglycine-generating enzyme required for sulfatase activity